MPGTLLTREYKGQTIQVMVLDNGFEYEGQVYRSLSRIAKLVTGSHWNGYGFFWPEERVGVGTPLDGAPPPQIRTSGITASGSCLR
jgi:hypothetical protein